MSYRYVGWGYLWQLRFHYQLIRGCRMRIFSPISDTGEEYIGSPPPEWVAALNGDFLNICSIFINPKDPTLQAYRYFDIKCWDNLHSLLPQVQTLTARTCHTISTEWNQPHFFSVPNVRRNSSYPKSCYVMGTESRLGASTNLKLFGSNLNRFIFSLSL